jgi:hypothetical protein
MGTRAVCGNLHPTVSLYFKVRGVLMSSFAIYAIGVVVIIVGLVYVASLTHVHTPWIVGMAILVAGAGLVGAANNTKKPE